MKITSAKVAVKTRNDVCHTSMGYLSVGEAVHRIEELNDQFANIWVKSDGWASIGVAGLLGKLRLDWQVSLSSSSSTVKK